MKTTTNIENAKRTATAKITGWCDVQMRAQAKKQAARAAGNAAAERVYFAAEIKASNRRSRHEDAMCRLCRMG